VNITPTPLSGVLLIEVDLYRDRRGFLFEAYQAERYAAAGIGSRFVQDNVSHSSRGVLRGLHFQEPFPQAKLVSVLHGEIFDVAVDVRAGSPTFGRWTAEVLARDNGRQMFIPEGFAHGFAVLSEAATVAYKLTDYRHGEAARSIAWNDPDIGIAWPIVEPILSEQDATAPRLSALAPADLPRFRPS
jgi:dTDP-4-dehydrorhamnose 3,5-epimerase